jgi:ATP-binding cassette subfamily A (ABC1) protein 3
MGFIKNTLDLEPYYNVRAKNLSGGNKRKLVCAMSLIACPQIEFLDEPTTGVDPVSRRSLFKMLKSLKSSSLILTTHRMDEAESLCDNIAIMINGKFAVYGSPGHLKSLYGEGYHIIVKHVIKTEDLEAFLASHFGFIELTEST